MIQRLGKFFLGPNTFNQGIYIGSAMQLGEWIPDNSVALILCDPVYWDMSHYEWLDRFGQRVLVPGGNLVAQCGNLYAKRAAERFRRLRWISTIHEYTGSGSKIGSLKMVSAVKPHLWFSKGPGVRNGRWLMNWLKSPGKSKQHHRWGDHPAMFQQLIVRLADGGIVVDPFTGGGTVPEACKTVGAPYVAFELDAQTARIAKERVARVSACMSGFGYTQLAMEDEYEDID